MLTDTVRRIRKKKKHGRPAKTVVAIIKTKSNKNIDSCFETGTREMGAKIFKVD